jgi:hypothetical protein
LRKLLIILGLLAIAPVLLLAACGDDDDDSGDDAGDATTAAAATEDGGDETEPAGETDAPEDTDAPADTGSAGGGGGDAACALITAEEAAEALGSPVDAPQSTTIGEGFSQCLWRIEGGGPADNAVVVQYRGDTSADEYAEQVDNNCPEPLGDPVPVSGIGDEAFECVALMVRQGDHMVVVTVVSSDVDGGLAAQEELAQKALTRLP